jgi:hypothetical protein
MTHYTNRQIALQCAIEYIKHVDNLSNYSTVLRTCQYFELYLEQGGPKNYMGSQAYTKEEWLEWQSKLDKPQ